MLQLIQLFGDLEYRGTLSKVYVFFQVVVLLSLKQFDLYIQESCYLYKLCTVILKCPEFILLIMDGWESN